MTPHIEAKNHEIAKHVIMTGDPNRASYIAKNYLTDALIVNNIRGMKAYTGFYKDKKVTIFSNGMGMPSMGIYAYELFKFYNVDKVIRIGTCGSYDKDLKLLDVVLAKSSYTISNFAYSFNGVDKHEVKASPKLNENVLKAAKKLDKKITYCPILTNDVFDPYIDLEAFLNRIPANVDAKVAEMEAFALFYLADIFKKDATCLITVVDSLYDKTRLDAKAREQALDDMIEIALEAL